MRLATAKKRYHNNWIAFRFTNEFKEEGQVVARDKDCDRLFRKLSSSKFRKADLYVTFAGPLVPEGYAPILFLPR